MKKPIPAILAVGIAAFAVAFVYAQSGSNSSGFEPIEKYRKEGSVLPDSKVAVLKIKISEADLEKIEERIQAIKMSKVGNNEGTLWVDARITDSEGKKKVELGIKGAGGDKSAFADRWYFRVKVKKDKAILGMELFSFEGVGAGEFLQRWLAAQWMQNQNVLAARTRIARVLVNGKSWGLQALEAGFDKILPESQHRTEAPIIKFDDELYWQAARQGLKPYAAEQYYRQEIEALRKKRTKGDPNLEGQFEFARGRLDGFRRERLKSSQVFDPQAMASYVSAHWMIGSAHPAAPRHLRLYYNPYTTYLEPIFSSSELDFDTDIRSVRVERAYEQKRAWLAGWSVLQAQLWRDPAMADALSALLAAMSKDGVSKGFSKEVEADARELSKELGLEKGAPAGFFARLKKNLGSLRAGTPVDSGAEIQPKALAAFYEGRAGEILHLKVKNLLPVALQIEGIRYVKDQAQGISELAFELPARDPKRAPVYHDYKIAMPKGMKWSDDSPYFLVLHYRKPGEKERWFENIFPYRNDAGLDERDWLNFPVDLTRFPMFRVDVAKSTLTLRRGSHRLDRTMVVPKGWTVIFEPGSELELARGVSWISQSLVLAKGTAEAPVHFTGLGGCGGLHLMAPAGESVFDHAKFTDLGAPAAPGLYLTGGVTIYGTKVRFENCRFEGARSEDALNVVSSEFVIRNCEFRNSASDGFDGDFVTGELLDSRFYDSGNDAVDFSGSQAGIDGLFVKNAGDKGISVGEASIIKVGKAEILGAKTALASKDNSVTTVEYLTARECKVGLALYQKKAEFGPGKATVKNYGGSGNTVEHVVEKGSVLKLRGKLVRTD